MRGLAALLCGLVFGLGLALAGMTSPQKVLAFLDVAGDWDPALLCVLGGAVVTAAIAFRFVLGRPRPMFDARFHLPDRPRIDAPLVIGSVLFGIGWGIAGYCPGPAVALLAVPGNPELPLFLGGMLAGIVACAGLRRRAAHPSEAVVRGD
jgi:uncharacterized membrane protein YedE/YeeE